jgi:hypothetical protein
MITLDPPFYFVRGMSLFRDHADPDLFWYLPPPPRLALRSDGTPAFTLFKWRRDLTDTPDLDPTKARGAGLAELEVEASFADPGVLRAEVAGKSGRPNARVAPVVFKAGAVHTLLGHDDSARGLVEDVVESQTPPLTAPHHVAFSLALSAEGATLVQRAAEGGELPVGVVYEMQFDALMPSIHATVRMDYGRIYDRFAASIGLQYYYIRAELDTDLQWLIENGAVQIEITQFTSGEDADRQRQMVMALVQARIQADFFRSGLPEHPTGGGLGGLLGQIFGGGSGEASSSSALFVLKAKYEHADERKVHTMVFDGRTAVSLPHVAASFLGVMFGEGVAPDVREIDLDDPFFSRLRVDVRSAVDFEGMADLQAVAVQLSYGDDSEAVAFTRDDASPRVFDSALTAPGNDTYTWSVEYAFDPAGGLGPDKIAAGPFTTRWRTLVVQPLDHLRYRRLRVVRGPLDAALVPRLHVHVRAPGPGDSEDDLAASDLVLDAANAEVVWRWRGPLKGPAVSALRVRADWEDAHGEVHRGDEVEVDGDTYVALGPYRDLMSVRVVPAVDWSKVVQVLVELRHSDTSPVFERTFVFTPSAQEPQIADIALTDPDRRTYRQRVTVIFADGTTQESDWSESDHLVLVAAPDRPTTRDVHVLLLGGLHGADAVRVDLLADGAPEAQSLLFHAAAPPELVATVPLQPDGTLRYHYSVHRYAADGETVVREADAQTASLVVQA